MVHGIEPQGERPLTGGSLLPTAPQGTGGNVDAGIKIFRAAFKRAAPLAAAASLAGSLPNMLLADFGDPFSDPSGTTAAVIGESADVISSGAGPAQVLGVIGCVLIYLLFFTAMIDSLATAARGQSSRISDHVTLARGRFLMVLLGMMIFVAAVAGGFMLFLVPGIWASVALVYFAYPIVLDNLSPGDAIKQSFHLTRHHWLRTATIWSVGALLVLLIYLVIFGGLSLVFGLGELVSTTGKMPGADAVIAVVLIEAVAGAISMPLMYSILLVGWNDLKLRKAQLDGSTSGGTGSGDDGGGSGRSETSAGDGSDVTPDRFQA